MSDPRRPGVGQNDASDGRMRPGQGETQDDALQDRNLAVQGAPDDEDEDMEGEEDLTDAVSALDDPEAGEDDMMDDEMDEGAGSGTSGGVGYR